MKIRFHRQQREYWCGPACIQMLDGSQKQSLFAKRMSTNSRTGTSRLHMVQQIRKVQRLYEVKKKASIAELQRKIPALVNYLEVEGDDHYAIVIRISKKFVTMHDPWHGPFYRLSRKTFSYRWKNPKMRKKYTGWFVALR